MNQNNTEKRDVKSIRGDKTAAANASANPNAATDTAADAVADAVEAALKYRLTGTVQNVGFRHFLLQSAKESGIRGWAKNESDGSLIVFVRGDKDAVSSFLPRLQGPVGADVSNMCELLVEGDDCPAEFEVR